MSVPYANSRSSLRAGKLADGLQRAVGVDREAAAVDVTNAPGLVDDDRHAPGEVPGVVPHAPALGAAPVDVAEQGERQLQRARPGQVARGLVGRPADDLRVQGAVLR